MSVETARVASRVLRGTPMNRRCQFFEHGHRQCRIRAAECASHSREIRERTTPFDGRQPSDRSPTIREASGASRTYVICAEGRVVGYYAPATGAIARAATTGRMRRQMRSTRGQALRAKAPRNGSLSRVATGA
jgi:hypothetical protein